MGIEQKNSNPLEQRVIVEATNVDIGRVMEETMGFPIHPLHAAVIAAVSDPESSLRVVVETETGSGEFRELLPWQIKEASGLMGAGGGVKQSLIMASRELPPVLNAAGNTAPQEPWKEDTCGEG